jgi:uncharacterized protein
VKFISDGMLGKLTRWLRILGQDVEYSIEMDDSELIVAAKTNRRILLTRDFELYQRTMARNVNVHYIKGRTEAEKIAELAKRYEFLLEIDMKKSRCPMCNTRIKPISKKELEENMEEKTFSFHDKFWTCPKCNKLYWQGSHWGGIKSTLEKAEKIKQSLT